MLNKTFRIDHPSDADPIGIVDEAEPTESFCLANVGIDDEPKHYLSCGEKLYRHKDGTTYCQVHGDMH